MHERVGALLPLSGKVAIGEMVAVEALTGSTVGVVEDARGGRDKCPINTLLKARPVAALAELL